MIENRLKFSSKDIKRVLLQVWQGWTKFWFGFENLLGLALMRIILCGTLLALYTVRAFNLEYYSATSWIPKEQALQVIHELYRPLFLWAFWPDSWNPFLHSVLLIALALLMVGVGGRVLMFLVWVLNAAFIQRNYSVNFGADIIANLFLFYMMWTQSCSRISLLNRIRKKPSKVELSILTSTMTRMIQIQLCVIYAYSGWEKLKGGSWWDGTALWSILANPQMTNFDLSFLRAVSWVIPLLTFVTVLFEIYFPALVAWNKTRPFVLLAGILMHFGIGFFMGLEAFALIMISSYFLFISPATLDRVFNKALNLFQIKTS